MFRSIDIRLYRTPRIRSSTANSLAVDDAQIPLDLPDIALDPLSFGAVSFEDGLTAATRLRDSYIPRNRNEATTRRQIIDRLLHDCLGWLEDDFIFEDRVESTGGYTDYTFTVPRPIFVLEAKREAKTFEVPAGQRRMVKLRTLCRTSPDLDAAIKQVRLYCMDRGVEFAAVSNGPQLAIFAAIRTDGSDPMDGRAMVFRSLADRVPGRGV